MSLDNFNEIRELFPQLKSQVRGRRLVYLDSAATTLKPQSVVEAVSEHMALHTANVHRGAHYLSDLATENFEAVREDLCAFLGAETKNEIIFTRGTTEGMNLLAHSLGSAALNEGDEILLSQMEHHSNIVPWQRIAESRKAVVRFAPVLEDGSIDFATFKKMLSAKTKIVSLVHLSNSLGTHNPLPQLFAEAKKFGAYCVADAAQSVAVKPIRVAELGCDFLAFSGHKMFGPTGVGVVYGKESLLNRLEPYQGGGSMISEVTEQGSTYLNAPHRFEAGTPPIAEVIGLGAALKFIKSVGFETIEKQEVRLMQLAEEELRKVIGLKRYGTAPQRGHVISFNLEGQHPSDVGAILDEQGVAVRAGHHCCQPLMRRFGVAGTVRASFSVYTSEQDILDFVKSVQKAKELLA